MGVLHLISDILSVITIAMSLVLKVPQIMSIYNLKSAQGINLYSLMLELSSYSTTASYNFVNNYSLMSYMEYPIIIAQEYVLIYLVLYYQNKITKKVIIATIIYFVLVWGFLSSFIPATLLTFLMPFCTPVSLSSKGIQLWQILSTQNADSVSVTTWVISAATNASRIYTILLDSGDMLLLSNFSLSALMSSAIAVSTYILHQKQD